MSAAEEWAALLPRAADVVFDDLRALKAILKKELSSTPYDDDHANKRVVVAASIDAVEKAIRLLEEAR
jgi:hypothetical protein